MIRTVRGFHILVFSRCVVALLFSTGCVSMPQYEQVSSAAEVEREAHRRTHVSLKATEQKIAELESRLHRSEGSLTDEAGARAELDLKQTTTERELGSSRELVVDLREEVGRLRDNLERAQGELVLLQTEKETLDQQLASAPRCPSPAEPNPSAPAAERGKEAPDAHATEQGRHEEAEVPPPPLPDRGV